MGGAEAAAGRDCAQGSASDRALMRRALKLAERGLGRTAPNPVVGAVVVAGGTVVGEGWHRAAGQPHAETEALAVAGDRAAGGTIYVTLEPCCHHGRTPPCAEAIIAAGIRRVVYACADPDPRCAGGGAAALRAAGLEVCGGILAEEAEALNEAYLTHKRTGAPFVTLKLACTLDGKLATRSGDSRWVTGLAAREHVHRLRDRNDAILVGVGTVLSDDPALTTRLPGGRGRDAVRVVADTWARTPADARVIGAGRCLVAVGPDAPVERTIPLEAAGAEIIVVPRQGGRLDLRALMRELGARDIMGLLCEGGARLAGGLLAAGLVNRLLMLYAPKLLGDPAALDAVTGLGIARMADALRLYVEDVTRVGEDLLVSAIPCSQGS